MCLAPLLGQERLQLVERRAARGHARGPLAQLHPHHPQLMPEPVLDGRGLASGQLDKVVELGIGLGRRKYRVHGINPLVARLLLCPVLDTRGLDRGREVLC